MPNNTYITNGYNYCSGIVGPKKTLDSVNLLCSKLVENNLHGTALMFESSVRGSKELSERSNHIAIYVEGATDDQITLFDHIAESFKDFLIEDNEEHYAFIYPTMAISCEDRKEEIRFAF